MRWWIYLLIGLAALPCHSQTCCSGGVPLASTIGFPSADRGTIQASLSHDLNVLHTLKEGTETLDDDSRLRLTNSLLLSAGYTLTRRLSVDVSFSYVWQRREISRPNLPRDLQQTHGMGDIMLLGKYQITHPRNNSWTTLVGLGAKLANGQTDIASEEGIIYNLDLQPGTGAVDGIVWLLSSYSLRFRPSAQINTQVLARFTGTFDEYLGSQSYEIGNNYHMDLGISDQFLINNAMLNASVTFRYRHAFHDRAQGQILENTGGDWLFLSPEIRWQLSSSFALSFRLEIPIYTRIEGEQLSTTLRTTTGAYYLWNPAMKGAVVMEPDGSNP